MSDSITKETSVSTRPVDGDAEALERDILCAASLLEANGTPTFGARVRTAADALRTLRQQRDEAREVALEDAARIADAVAAVASADMDRWAETHDGPRTAEYRTRAIAATGIAQGIRSLALAPRTAEGGEAAP